MNLCPQLQNLQEEYDSLFCRAISAEDPRQFLKEYCSLALMSKIEDNAIFEIVLISNYIIRIIEPNNACIFYLRNVACKSNNNSNLEMQVDMIAC